jgi:hypothetical protein
MSVWPPYSAVCGGQRVSNGTYLEALRALLSESVGLALLLQFTLAKLANATANATILLLRSFNTPEPKYHGMNLNATTHTAQKVNTRYTKANHPAARPGREVRAKLEATRGQEEAT